MPHIFLVIPKRSLERSSSSLVQMSLARIVPMYMRELNDSSSINLALQSNIVVAIKFLSFTYIEGNVFGIIYAIQSNPIQYIQVDSHFRI